MANVDRRVCAEPTKQPAAPHRRNYYLLRQNISPSPALGHVLSAAAGACISARGWGAPCRTHRARRSDRIRPRDCGLVRPSLGRSPPAKP